MRILIADYTVDNRRLETELSEVRTVVHIAKSRKSTETNTSSWWLLV